MGRLESRYITRDAVSNPSYANGRLPKKFELGEILRGIAPHEGHNGDMRVEEFLEYVQVMAVCTVPGCGTECIVTGVLSEMGEPT